MWQGPSAKPRVQEVDARSHPRPRKLALRLPRIPLPAKLLLSYLLLLALAAVPNFLYVRSSLEKGLLEQAQHELLETARRTAGILAPLDDEARILRARELSQMTGQRVTLTSASSAVVMDSETSLGEPLAPKTDRPEILEAAATGSGVARRVSEKTGQETLYAAVRLPVSRGASNEDDGAAVVRVGRALASLRTSTEELTRFERNVQAGAISVALLLSLLAAMRFVRPLQRVIATARSLGAGDLAAHSGVATDDEVGDAGRALDTMAVELRRRLANAGSGDAVLSQLVDALPIAVVVFEVTGELLALNGAARSAFGVEGPNASKRLKELTSSASFERALENAEGDGEPEALEIEVAGARVRGSVHVLKRPGAAPLHVLLGEGMVRMQGTTLPPFENVAPHQLAEVLDGACADARSGVAAAAVALEVSEVPAVAVVDVDQRIRSAISAVLLGCARAVSGRQEILAVEVKVEPTRVRLVLQADPGAAVIDTVRPLLEPLGGDVRVDREHSTTMWIPRA